jgi:hypothetical protein
MKLLAQRLIYLFPNIINDFYTAEEYYGETALHMGIVNENAEIVRFLLRSGASVGNNSNVCRGFPVEFFRLDPMFYGTLNQNLKEKVRADAMVSRSRFPGVGKIILIFPRLCEHFFIFFTFLVDCSFSSVGF